MGFMPLYHHRRGEGVWPLANIAYARATLVVLSPQLEGSALARMEYLGALQAGALIIPLQTGAEMRIPTELQSLQWVDFYELYERGLANLSQALSGSRPRGVLRRVAFADISSKIIPLVRLVLATIMMFMWIVMLGDLTGLGLFAFIPAIFIAVGEENYRRGDKVGFRIMLTRILMGATAGALVAFFGMFVAPLTADLPLVVVATLAGGFLAWLLTRVEQRSLSLGRFGAQRTLSIFSFCFNTAITFLALFTFTGASAAQPTFRATAGFVTFDTALSFHDPLTVVEEVGVILAISVLLAAGVEWLRSPVRYIKSARRQLVEAGSSPANAVPVAATTVFISHSSGDNDFAIKLSRDLQQGGVATWTDRRQLRPGMSWPDEIRRALESSQVILLALSSLALLSDWVRHEYQSALSRNKAVIVMRLESSCAVPPELSRARVVDFATLYVNGLADVLVTLHASQEAITRARQSLRRQLRFAWLTAIVRLVASGYLIIARTLVFGVASFTALGGFDHVAGVGDLGSYILIWLGRAAPGAILGLFVSLLERARVEGAKPSRWLALSRTLNGALTGEGWLGVWSVGIFGLLLSPITAFLLLFFSNQSLEDIIIAVNAPSQTQAALGQTAIWAGGFLILLYISLGVGVVNSALAIPLARSERRDREEGKRALVVLSRIFQLASRVGIGAMGVIIPSYLLFASPVNPFGPPDQTAWNSFYLCFPWALALGVAAGATELFFFPAGPSRQALRKLRETVAPALA
jgi:hypothetical protein